MNKMPIIPYLLRAAYDWIVDNNYSPLIYVDATARGVFVPKEFLDEEGAIILNIAPGATNRLKIDNETIEFDARFANGRESIEHICVPIYAVAAIYARENGCGLQLSPEILCIGDEPIMYSASEIAALAEKITAPQRLNQPARKGTATTSTKPKPKLTLIKKGDAKKDDL